MAGTRNAGPCPPGGRASRRVQRYGGRPVAGRQRPRVVCHPAVPGACRGDLPTRTAQTPERCPVAACPMASRGVPAAVDPRAVDRARPPDRLAAQRLLRSGDSRVRPGRVRRPPGPRMDARDAAVVVQRVDAPGLLRLSAADLPAPHRNGGDGPHDGFPGHDAPADGHIRGLLPVLPDLPRRRTARVWTALPGRVGKRLLLPAGSGSAR